MPDIRVVDGARLRLNGMGLRTFSILGIHIYVAGLYLEHRSDNPDSILHLTGTQGARYPVSPRRRCGAGPVSMEGRLPRRPAGLPECYVDPKDIERFLESLPPIQKGDETTMIFTSRASM